MTAAKGGSWKREGKPEVFSSFLTAQLSLQHLSHPLCGCEAAGSHQPRVLCSELRGSIRFSGFLRELLNSSASSAGGCSRERPAGRRRRERESVSTHPPRHLSSPGKLAPGKAAPRPFRGAAACQGAGQWEVSHGRGARRANGGKRKPTCLSLSRSPSKSSRGRFGRWIKPTS